MARLRISRLEGAAIAFLAISALAATAAVLFLRNGNADTLPPPTEKQLEQYQNFEVSRQGGKSIRHSQARRNATAARLSRFNPNTADSAALVTLGLRPGQAMAIVHYRNAGGSFRKKEDLKRIYTITEADYARLAPYISIPQREKETAKPVEERKYHNTKLKSGETVDLNCGDTTLLKRVPGVGSVLARRIVGYGELLGGYVSPAQAAEVFGLDRNATVWFCVKTPSPKRININTAGYAQIIRHPYFNKRQTKHIMRLRREWGRITSIKALEADSAFTPQDIRRIEPYIEL